MVEFQRGGSIQYEQVCLTGPVSLKFLRKWDEVIKFFSLLTQYLSLPAQQVKDIEAGEGNFG